MTQAILNLISSLMKRSVIPSAFWLFDNCCWSDLGRSVAPLTTRFSTANFWLQDILISGAPKKEATNNVLLQVTQSHIAKTLRYSLRVNINFSMNSSTNWNLEDKHLVFSELTPEKYLKSCRYTARFYICMCLIALRLSCVVQKSSTIT